MVALLTSLLNENDVEFLVIGRTHIIKLSQEGCETVSRRLRGLQYRSSDLIETVKSFGPDLIHVHGTEGIALVNSKKVKIAVPVVYSLQGLSTVVGRRWEYFGRERVLDRLKTEPLKHLLTFNGYVWDYFKFAKRIELETRLFKDNPYVIGRTSWDLSVAMSLGCTRENYFYGSELLREPFYKKVWNKENFKSKNLLFVSPSHPRKGFRTFIAACHYLVDIGELFQLTIVGVNKTDKVSQSLIETLITKGIQVNLKCSLNASELSDAMCESSALVCAGYIDNSPNLVCEAQMLGLPVIASYVGGVPSLIEHGSTGLLHSAGDEFSLVSQILALFNENSLAIKLSVSARRKAIVRHDRIVVPRQYWTIYNNILTK